MYISFAGCGASDVTVFQLLNSTMLGARRPVNGDTESPVVVGASRVCAALAGAVCMQLS